MAHVRITEGQRTRIRRLAFPEKSERLTLEAKSQLPLLEGLTWSPMCVCHLGGLPPFSWVQGRVSCLQGGHRPAAERHPPLSP